MTTEEMLEAIAGVLCEHCGGLGCAVCQGTQRMFWRLVEKCPALYWDVGKKHPPVCRCGGSGYLLIQHDRLEAVMESLPNYMNLRRTDVPSWEVLEEQAHLKWLIWANGADTPLDAATNALYQWVVSRGFIKEEVG